MFVKLVQMSAWINHFLRKCQPRNSEMCRRYTNLPIKLLRQVR